MSVLGIPRVAAAAATGAQGLVSLAEVRLAREKRAAFPDLPSDIHGITVPTSVAPARAVVYRPAASVRNPPVHVNFHGGGFILPGIWLDDPLCRLLAAEAGVVVVNVDYVLAPRHPFPSPPRQAFEVVRWVAEHGAEHGWDGTRLTIGGQSAGGGIAAAVARQALERGGPEITLQALLYPVLDLTLPMSEKPSAIDRPMLRPWMGEVFDNSYVPDPAVRADRLASPAGPADTEDLTGIAPAFLITPEYDLLRAEGQRYARRLRDVGALAEHCDVPGADHGFDVRDLELARAIYALIADHLTQADAPRATSAGRG
ncbi:alpha/beta hydrolase fold domain-containing protein [Spiractinospora alimapuensis]|uniref:alpha/beta hydrolase fold domain-containing protein n=1 Tax=Spiractinospora alimapuensis TaxID=2820884 RepID=UPI001F2C015E|nr:alpha/beta hydrolase fold domain-containing protein [Spiractinospora alimapuensis]QVQ50882.1 alpha/beta hydrolase fold domain-containing protein [Spiractinospora alimapuensis]